MPAPYPGGAVVLLQYLPIGVDGAQWQKLAVSGAGDPFGRSMPARSMADVRGLFSKKPVLRKPD